MNKLVNLAMRLAATRAEWKSHVKRFPRGWAGANLVRSKEEIRRADSIYRRETKLIEEITDIGASMLPTEPSIIAAQAAE